MSLLKAQGKSVHCEGVVINAGCYVSLSILSLFLLVHAEEKDTGQCKTT